VRRYSVCLFYRPFRPFRPRSAGDVACINLTAVPFSMHALQNQRSPSAGGFSRPTHSR
jgi:hypothetical protein